MTEVQIVRDWPSLSRNPTPAPPKPKRAVGAPDVRDGNRDAPSVDTLTHPLLEAAPSNVAASIPSTAPAHDQAERRGLASALRGSVGCAEAHFNELTSAEQQNCRDRFATAAEGVHDEAELGIDPIKRAVYDASWKADHGPQHMAGVACVAVFGKGA